MCEEQTGAFEYHGALELDGAPDQEPIGHWSMGLINNRRARSETMGPLELAGVPDEEVPICHVIFRS